MRLLRSKSLPHLVGTVIVDYRCGADLAGLVPVTIFAQLLMKALQIFLLPAASLFLQENAKADQTYWSGIAIKIDGLSADVSVTLTTFVDSANTGKIRLILQDEKYKPLESTTSSAVKEVTRGIQSLVLSDKVKLKEGQKNFSYGRLYSRKDRQPQLLQPSVSTI